MSAEGDASEEVDTSDEGDASEEVDTSEAASAGAGVADPPQADTKAPRVTTTSEARTEHVMVAAQFTARAAWNERRVPRFFARRPSTVCPSGDDGVRHRHAAMPEKFATCVVCVRVAALMRSTTGLALACALALGCTPTAAPPDDAAADDARVDSATRDTAGDDRTATDDMPSTDAARADTSSDDATADGALTDGSSVDASMVDVRVADGSSVDASVVDSGVADASIDAPRADASAVDASTVDASTVDASAVDASAVDASAVDAARTDASAVDASTGDGLPPLDVYDGPLPVPSRAPILWGPLRITRRAVTDGVATPVERLVFAWSDGRVNAVDTERWSGGVWRPYERTTWVYGTTGRIEGRFVWRNGPSWTQYQRWRYEFNADGTLRVEHGDVMSAGAWAETMQRTWEWVGTLVGWQRYYEAPAVGRASVKHWENNYEYDASGRLTGYLRYELPAALPPLYGSGRRVETVRATGQMDRETFIYSGVRADTVYRYNRAGLVAEVASSDTVQRYAYDATTGRLQFVRTYTRFDTTWSLTTEVELEHTDAGSDATFSRFTDPLELWRRDYYGRGDLVDRYRR